MTADHDIQYRRLEAEGGLRDYVQCFWWLHNIGASEKAFVILPDAHFDLVFHAEKGGPFIPRLSGLATQTIPCNVASGARLLAVSFALPAADGIFTQKLAPLLNAIAPLPEDFWGLGKADFTDLPAFQAACNRKLKQLVLSRPADSRLIALSRLLSQSDGTIPVATLAKQVFWSSRQMNRWFNSRLGLSLKAYADLLRYRAAFDQLQAKRLYPDRHYADQSHFIKTVKKYSDLTPGEIAQNTNGRFVQLSTLHLS